MWATILSTQKRKLITILGFTLNVTFNYATDGLVKVSRKPLQLQLEQPINRQKIFRFVGKYAAQKTNVQSEVQMTW